MILVPNKNVIVPANEEIIAQRQTLKVAVLRLAHVEEFDLDAQAAVTLSFTPIVPEWVELYYNGVRVINPHVANTVGGAVYKKYNVVGNQIIFDTPLSGTIKVISDTEVTHDYRATILDVMNVQKNQGKPGLYCEPIVITQPIHGYTRLSTDRQSIAYVPDVEYSGVDTFTYSTITQNGQVGVVRCAFVVIR